MAIVPYIYIRLFVFLIFILVELIDRSQNLFYFLLDYIGIVILFFRQVFNQDRMHWNCPFVSFWKTNFFAGEERFNLFFEAPDKQMIEQSDEYRNKVKYPKTCYSVFAIASESIEQSEFFKVSIHPLTVNLAHSDFVSRQENKATQYWDNEKVICTVLHIDEVNVWISASSQNHIHFILMI